jgi:hypothetical protein
MTKMMTRTESTAGRYTVAYTGRGSRKIWFVVARGSSQPVCRGFGGREYAEAKMRELATKEGIVTYAGPDGSRYTIPE